MNNICFLNTAALTTLHSQATSWWSSPRQTSHGPLGRSSYAALPPDVFFTTTNAWFTRYIYFTHIYRRVRIYIYRDIYACRHAHTQTHVYVYIYIYAYIYIYIYIYWNDHGSVKTPRVFWWFFGGYKLGNFWCVIWPWYTTRVFWWFFRGNNPWHLDIEMIMVALRLHGLEAGTGPERSGSGAGAERERSGFDDFNVFSWFSCLPLRSRFTPAFFFSCFFIFFCSFSSCFWCFGFLNIFFDFLDVFMFFFWNCLIFFGKDSKFYE